MQYISHCESPLGKLLLSADDLGLTGIWFEGQKYFPPSLKEPFEEKEVPVIKETKRWLTISRHGFPENGVGNLMLHSLWKNHDLWRNCQTDCLSKRHPAYVCPGSRRGCGAQQNFHSGSLSPGCGNQWQPHRICRRHG